jgi:hypothetical protein
MVGLGIPGGGGTEMPLVAPKPRLKPPPGSPICPSMAARTTVIHTGCSPWSARWIDQLVATMVLVAAIRRDSATIVSASMPVRPAAQRASFAIPSRSPRKYAAKAS